MRRVLFLREEGSVGWVAKFGGHPRLKQRAMSPSAAEVMPFSFVVVDEETVIMSVPGSGALDEEAYTTAFVLRHLIVIRDRAVAKVFLRMHEQLLHRRRVPTTNGDAS